MTKIREEIEKITKRVWGVGGYHLDRDDGIVKKDKGNDELEKLFRSWVEDILIELRHIRANAPLTVGDKGKTRERLGVFIKKIEEASK